MRGSLSDPFGPTVPDAMLAPESPQNEGGGAVIKSVALGMAAATLLACAAQSQPSAEAVAAQRERIATTTAESAACQAQYARLFADDDRDFRAALRANAADADQPSLAELKRTVAETKGEFDRRDGALARKIHECDAIAREEMEARDRLWALCHDARAAPGEARRQADTACR